MSGSLIGVGGSVIGVGQQLLSVTGLGQQLNQATGGLLGAFIKAPRSIGTIIPDVTIEESHSDRLTVTQHPIAIGSPIHDHAYKMPATVTMRVGFTNSAPLTSAIQGFQSGGGFGDIGGGLLGAGQGLLSSFTEQRVKDIYNKLLKLQFDQSAWDKGNIPVDSFQLTTGKRTYPNMVIIELSIHTDHTTEYALMVECHMQEIFIVQTAQTTQPAQTDQANPQKTASPSQQSDQAPTPTERTPSLISQGVQGIGAVFKNLLGPGTPAP